MALNGRTYPNNSIIDKADISTSVAVLCLTSRYPCCSDSQDGSWYHPDGTQLREGYLAGDYYQQYGSPKQTVQLYRSVSTSPEGLFHCEALDQLRVRQYVYIGIYSSGAGE